MKPIKLNLSSWQGKVWLDNHRYKVINCGRRAGKSYASAYKMLHIATENNKSIIWYIAPTYRQAKSIMWEMLSQAVPSFMITKKNETELRIDLINGSSILLKGADSPDSLRGVRIDFCIFDECAFIDKWDDAWKVIRPTLMDSKASVWFISTPNGFNHFKTLAESTDPDWAYFHFTTYDNPHIEKEEIDRSRLEMDEDSFAQEIMGEFRKMSGLIYKDFDREKHMVEIPDIEGWTRTRSIDFGFGHKTALVYFAINSDGSQIYAYDGLYQSGMNLDQMAEAIKIKDGKKYMNNPVADSAQPLNIQELTNRGVHFNPIAKGPDSVKLGITKVAGLLKVRQDTGKPTLMFNKELEWIAYEFERYRWMENKSQGIVKEAPVKSEDDAMDAIRYFAMSYNQETNEDVYLPDDTKLVEGWY